MKKKSLVICLASVLVYNLIVDLTSTAPSSSSSTIENMQQEVSIPPVILRPPFDLQRVGEDYNVILLNKSTFVDSGSEA